jgi:hypothetical protein
MTSINIYPFAFEKPGVPGTKSNTQKWNFNKISTAKVDLKDYPEGNEMLGAEIYFTGPIYKNEQYNATAKFYDDNTNQVLWTGTVGWESLPSGYEYWNWYRMNFWIGHFQWEIFKAMTIRIEIKVTGTQTLSKTLYMTVVDTTQPTPPAEGEVKSKKRIELEFQDLTKFGLINLVAPGIGFIGGGTQKLLEKREDIKQKVQFELPQGWTVTNIELSQGKYLYVDLEERGSPELVITTTLVIIGIVAAVLILFGLLVTTWKITDTINNNIEYKKVKEKSELAAELIKLGIDPEDVTKILEGVEPTPPEGEKTTIDEFKDILLMAIIGIIIITFVQQIGKK